MMRTSSFVLVAAFVSLLLACGGGTDTSKPAGDFSLSLSPNSLSLQQLGGGAEIIISVNPVDEFAGAVNITFPNLPAGITVAAVGFSVGPPYTAAPGVPLGIGVDATQAAAIGNSSIVVQGTSGSLTHTATLSLLVSAAAQFQLSVSPSTVTIGPNGLASSQVTLIPGANFGNSTVGVNVTSDNLGSYGVQMSYSSEFLTAAQPQTTISFKTGFEVQTGNNIAVPLTAVLGDQVVNIPLTLDITNPAPACNSLSRSTIRRTDMDPTGVVYDPVHKLVFAAVEQMNAVRVYSSATGQNVATIPVAAPRELDITPDGSRVLVGSLAPFLWWIDPLSLQVVEQSPVVSSLFSNSIASFPPMPLQPVILASGKALVAMGGGTPDEWDPTTNIWSNPTPSGFSAASAMIRRSSDHTKVVVAGNGLAIFDSSSDSYGPVQNLSVGAVALNSDGSKLAVIEASPTIPGGSQVVLFDQQFNVLATYQLISGGADLIFSRDDSLLYVFASGIIALRTTDLSFAGVAPSSGGGGAGYPSDIDETGMIFSPGIQQRSVVFNDASAPCALGTNEPFNMSLTPPQGAVHSPQATSLTAAGGITAQSQVYFGVPPGSPQATPGTNVTPSPPTSLQVTPPNAQFAGVVNVTVTNPDGSVGIAADGYSYGSNVLWMPTNSGPAGGGTSVTIYGYGFAFQQDQIQVTVGGKPASVTNASAYPGISPFPFPMDRVTFTTPAGTPGAADVVITTPVGSATIAGGFHYFQNAQSFPVSSTLAEIVYDKSRQRLYAADYQSSVVDVFDLNGQKYLSPISVGNSPQALAITTDFNKLVVSNGGDGSISIVDLTGASATKTVSVLSLPNLPAECGAPIPYAVATTSQNQAVIALQCPNVTAGEYIVLDLANQEIGCGSSQGCAAMMAAYPQNLDWVLTIAGTPDGGKILLWNGVTTGLWDVNADTFISQPSGDTTLPSPVVLTAADATGTDFGEGYATYDPSLYQFSIMQDPDYLQTGVNDINGVGGEKLHPSGALLYFPETGGFSIYDVHHGHLVRRIALSSQIAPTFDAMAIDETGSRIFLISSSGLLLVNIPDLPLSIGNLVPAQGSASGGVVVQVGGSGFENGAQVLFNDTPASVTYVDSSSLQVTSPTLPVGPTRITVVNPDGTQYFIDDAFVAQ